MIIISSKGIFDASGCKIYIKDLNDLGLIHLSSGHFEMIAEFNNSRFCTEAYDQILAEIQAGTRQTDISPFEREDERT
ncbi:MAG: hypothetical protein OXI63_02275 [Candidatus Poribacteria bacterium]|nr:hypothetical protein [Candidatus Poribacteria bacterium]